MIRISSGWCSGMQLASPEGLTTRPTSSRARQAVWNSLQTKLADALVLDLFAGSGAVGIEALSRGAAGCVFVESDRQAIKALKQNISEVERRAIKQSIAVKPLEAVCADVKEALGLLMRRAHKFDLIWADPPYADTATHLPLLLAGTRRLCSDGILIIESGAELSAADWHGWQIDKVKEYGETVITFLKVVPVDG